jgi:hypothetical protein
MYRLLFLFVALGLALAAVRLLLTADAFFPYVVRDVLLLAAMAALIFALQAGPPPATTADQRVTAQRVLLLAALTLTAAFVRFWQVSTLPPECLDAECEQALRLAEETGATTAFGGLARLFFAITGEGLTSLRLAGAALGSLAVPAFYLVARRWTVPSGALLATALLALSPWHLLGSRSSDPAGALPLLIFFLLWAMINAVYAPRSLRLRSLFWVYGVSAIGLLILLINEFWSLATVLPAENRVSALPALLRPVDGAAALLFADTPVTHILVLALGLLGLGYAIRNSAQTRFTLLLAILVLTAVLVVRAELPLISTVLALIAPLFLLAALGLDRLYDQLQQNWRILVRPAYLFGVALAVVALIGGRDSVRLFAQFGSLTTAGLNAEQAALSRYLTQELQAGATEPVTFYVPATILASPNLRLSATSGTHADGLRPLEAALADLAHGASPHMLNFLVPAEDTQWLDLLRQLFPDAQTSDHLDDESGQRLFTTLTVPPALWVERQGLLGAVIADNGGQYPLPPGPLVWEPDVEPPLTLFWQGMLLVPLTGDYGFTVTGVNAGADRFTLHLDGQPVLDANQGRLEQTVPLTRGLYRIDILHRVERTSSEDLNLLGDGRESLTVRWRPPDAEWGVIPQRALLSAPLPPTGLIATYYGNLFWEGPPIETRKEWLIAPPPDLPLPYSGRWQGQVAAPRAGDYLFGVQADGPAHLRIAGQSLIAGDAPADAEPVLTESLIYLNKGWHEFDLRYAPASEQPTLRLLWQPAGSAPASLGSPFVAPVIAGAGGAPPPPPAPPLLDERLGNDEFAFSPVMSGAALQLRLPVTGLPLLPFVLQWQSGEGCGNDERLLDQPHGVLIDSTHNLILVADTANRRVALFDWQGAMAGSIHDDRFEEPFALARGGDGSPLLLDALAQQLFRLDPSTASVEPLPASTSFYRPRGLAVDGLGNLLVADTGGGRVVIMQSDGSQIGQFGGPDTPLARGQPVDVLAAGPFLWAVTAEDGRLWRLDTVGAITAVQPTNTLNGPHLAALPDGSFFLSDPERGMVLYHTADGQPRGQLAAPGGLLHPTGVDGQLLNEVVYLAVVDSGNCTLSWWAAPVTELPR